MYTYKYVNDIKNKEGQVKINLRMILYMTGRRRKTKGKGCSSSCEEETKEEGRNGTTQISI